MDPVAVDNPSAKLIESVDAWAALLEVEDYQGALDFTVQDAAQNWTAELLRLVIKSYGDAQPAQRVTVVGKATDISQRKAVDWWTSPRRDAVGEVWYDLNIDGEVSDLTASFDILQSSDGYVLRLRDVHVM